jgi:hypothetical protein
VKIPLEAGFGPGVALRRAHDDIIRTMKIRNVLGLCLTLGAAAFLAAQVGRRSPAPAPAGADDKVSFRVSVGDIRQASQK